MGTLDQPLQLTDEEVRMVAQAGAGYETHERFMARVAARLEGIDVAQIPAGSPEDLQGGSIVARRRAPADQPDEVVVTHGYPDKHSPDEWTTPEGYRIVQLPPAAPTPTGHVRLAWLAVVGIAALLLAAPVAVADAAPKKPAPVQKARPDAGTPNRCPQSNWPCDCPGNPDCTIKPG